MLGVGLRRTPNIQFEREYLDLKDGGVIGLDWVFPNQEDLGETSETIAEKRSHSRNPTLIILHGLTGGSHESYVRHTILSMKRDSAFLWNCVVFNFRGAGDTPLKTPRSYSGVQTEDLDFVVNHIHQKLPNSPLYTLGYSLGSNIMVKYLGEQGSKVLLKGAISISNPYYFELASKHLEGSFFLRNVYSRAFAQNLRKYILRHYNVAKQSTLLDPDEVLAKATSLRSFDEYATRRLNGFATVDDYYRAASSANYLKRVEVPLLCLSALDDPIIHPSTVPYSEVEKNGNILLVTTRRGGHVAWILDWNLFSLNNSLMDSVSTQFLDATHEHYLLRDKEYGKRTDTNTHRSNIPIKDFSRKRKG